MIKIIINTLTLLFVLLINYLSNTDFFNSKTVGEVSKQYDTLFTPAGYAFAIWGLIYSGLIVFVCYQWYLWNRKKNLEIISRTSWWFAIANMANGIWVVLWVQEYIGFSVLIMFILLISLIMLAIRLRLEVYDAPNSVIFFVWWPLTIYLGWIVLATVANISAFLKSTQWDGGPFSGEIWTIILILTSTLIYILLIYFRNMREAAMVGVWGLVAIASRQWESYQNIVTASIIGVVLLFLYVIWHGYKNRASSPMARLMNKQE